MTDNQASHGVRWPGSPARRLGRARGACLVIRTPDRRVRVFISSTMAELAAERRAVTDAITQLRLTPVLFEIGARPYPPRELYRAYLQQSDVFLGIYGGFSALSVSLPTSLVALGRSSISSGARGVVALRSVQ